MPALAAPALAQPSPEIKWRLTSSFGKTFEVMSAAVSTLCKHVAEATDNQFQIQPFTAGELAPSHQALDAVASATVECAFTPLSYYIGKDPTLAFGSGVPFGLDARQQLAWWHFGGGADLINASLKRLNVYGIPAGMTGTQMGAWSRKEINGVEDLKDLRIRILGLGGPILGKLGAIPYKMAHADAYPALENATLDAAEFVCPVDDEKLGLAKVARFNYFPCWWESAGMLHLVINQERWAALPKSYQAVLSRACEAACVWMQAKYDLLNPAALKRLSGAGVAFKPFPGPVLDACFKATGEHLADLAGKSVSFKKALETTQGFRSEHLPWLQMADHAFEGYMIAARGKA